MAEVLIDEEARFFSQKYDSNPAHLKGKNLILPDNSVSGIYLLSLINEAVINSNLFMNLLCANKIFLNFIRPVIIGQTLKIFFEFKDRMHKFKEKIVVRYAKFYVYREKELVMEARIKYMLES
ncbi:MAG: hypothetical protein NTZ67_08160 [Gammaproteobacteria bacterium]|nr:hypothetical protein [Gammaproteobacteria bacterium]